MSASCKAPLISYLPQRIPKTLIRNSQNSNFTPQSNRRQFSSRRQILLLSGFLLLPNRFESGSSSSYAATQFDPVTPIERDASALLSQRVTEAVELLEKGRELQAQGDFNGALTYFSQVINFRFYFYFFLFLLSLSHRIRAEIHFISWFPCN